MSNNISEIIKNTFDTIKSGIDADNIVGTPVRLSDGNVVIPISKVSFGYVSGGGEYGFNYETEQGSLPYAGGIGAGATITPIGFVSVNACRTSFLKIDDSLTEDKWANLLKNALSLLK